MYILPQDVLLFSQIFGGFPLTYTTSPKGDKTIEFCSVGFLWGLVTLMFQTVLSYVALYVDYTGKLTGQPIRMADNDSVMPGILDAVSLNFMAIIIFVTTVWKHRDFIEMTHILGRIDKSLAVTHKPRLSIEVILNFTFIVTLLPLTVVSLESQTSLENGSIYYIPLLTLYCNQAALSVHFTHVTQSIASRFKVVNERIKEELMNQKFGHMIRERNLLHDGNLAASDTSSVFKIRTLTDLHWLLREAVLRANRFYSVQLLAFISSSFIRVIIVLYYFFLQIWPTIDPKDWLYLTVQGLWALIISVHLVLLVWTGTAVTNVANETAPMICKIINEDLNPDLRKQIDTFLLQILHRNARFSAQGFFQIHNHILSSIAGSVTTYLVILIQFQTSDSPQQNSDSPQQNSDSPCLPSAPSD